MTTNLASASWRGRCVGCGQPFTEWGWDHRHDINQLDADLHHIDIGEYHDACCPLPACAPSFREVTA